MRFRRATALAVGLTSLGASASAPASAFVEDAAASPRLDPVERSVVRKLNRIRADHGIRALRRSRALARAADAHSAGIASSGVFAHGDVRSRVGRYVRATTIGETLAWVPAREGRRARAVVQAWMRSPAHRTTLLSPRFSRIGIARRRATLGGGPAVVFTADLASAR